MFVQSMSTCYGTLLLFENTLILILEPEVCIAIRGITMSLVLSWKWLVTFVCSHSLLKRWQHFKNKVRLNGL